MISDTFRHHGRCDIGQDKDLSDLLANFDFNRPKSLILFPKWNLSWVLTWLNSDKFEPLAHTSLKLLSFKTCFLVALASACRVSELHALSSDPNYLQFRSDGSVVLLTQPGFVSKNRLPSLGNQKVVIRSLSSIDKSRTASMQDPVRALKTYLKRTKASRDTRTRHFLPVKAGKRDITPQALASWLKWVIRSAYSELSPDQSRLLKIHAHEIRAISASLAFARNFLIRDIIDAVGWHAESTFSSFYLRDLTSQRQTLNLVGPVSAAQMPSRPFKKKRKKKKKATTPPLSFAGFAQFKIFS